MNAQDLLARLKTEGLVPSLKLRLDGDAEPSAETLELVRRHKADLLSVLANAESIPHLPWQLKRLLAAASGGGLPAGTVTLEAGLVTDLNGYTLAWGVAYIIGDQDEALRRLWQAHRAWQGVN